MDHQERTSTDLRKELERLRRRIAELESRGAVDGRREKELLEGEEHFTLFMRHLPGFAYLKDHDRRILFVSDRFEKDFGVRVKDWIGRTNDEIWPGDVGEKIRRDDEFVLSRGERIETEEVVPTKGELRTYHTVKFPIPRSGQPPWLGGISIDITEGKRIEEALRESEDRLSFMMSNSPAIIFTCRPSGEFGATFVTPNVQHQLGYDPRTFTSNPGFWASHIHPDDKQRIFDGLSSLFANGSHVHEYRFRHQDGTWRWMHDELRLIRDEAGEPLEILGSWLDITDRKRAEENLLQRTKALATLLEVSRGLAATLDMEEVLQATTDGVTHLFGLGTAAVYLLEGDMLVLGATTPPLPQNFPESLRNAVLGGHPHIREAISSGKPILVPDMMTADLTPAERSVAEQRGLRSVLFLPLIAGVKSVGTLIAGTVAEPRTISEAEIDLCRTLANLAAIAVENARLFKSGQRYAADLEQQMAEREQAEEALRESERKYRALFDSATDAIFILDLDGNILDVNRTAHTRLGYTKQEMLSMHLSRLDLPEFAAKVPERSARIARQGEAVFESAHRRRDGSVMPVEVNSRLLEYEGRQVFFSIVRDITERKRMEEALKESEEKFRSVFDSASDGILLADPHTKRFVLGNATIARMLGVGLDDLRNLKVADIHPAEALQDVFRSFEKAERGETPFTGNVPVLRKDGSVFFADIATSWVKLKGATYMAGFFRDITERKRMGEALRASEKRYRELFETAQEGIAITDMQGNYLECNRAYLEMLGLDSLDDLQSRSYEELTPPEYHELERRIIREQTLVRGYCDEYEKEYVRRTGERVPVSLRAWLRLDDDNRPAGMWVIVRDITERKRAEAALRESEERLRLALSAAKQGLYDLNVQTGEAVVTPEYARMLGYAPEDFTETNAKWIERLHPDDQAPVADTYRAYVSGEIPEYRVEFRQRTRSGEWKWILSIGKIVEYDASGNPLRMLGTHTDITDRKHTEEERLDLERRLLHAQKLESLGVLAGGIAHDFNNLLMAVLGNLDLALRNASLVAPVRANIEQSVQAARRATDLTRQMLAYSGKGRFIVRAMDLSELVEENTHLLRASVARTAALNVHLDRSLPAIEADTGQVQQVIMNLITNASEAIGDKAGTITITTGVQECDAQCLKRSRIEDVPEAGRFVYLEVSDTGCGMDEQTQHRLFDPFFTTKAPGRGLGMSAILGIVRGHGGAIFVASDPGKGTTIRILFPALQGARAVNEGPLGARAAETETSVVSGTVLVVDDEEIVRRVCTEMVEAMGLQVLTAVDGRDAIDVFTRHAGSISHVILDLSMPNMDGMAAFTELVRIKPGIRVILSSGFDEQDSLQRLSGRGLAGFIQKPYSMQNLRDALEKAGAAGA